MDTMPAETRELDFRLALASSWIYEPERSFEMKARDSGMRLVNWFDKDGTQAALIEGHYGQRQPFAAIVFRGTQVASGGTLFERLRDITTNIRLLPESWDCYGDERVHSGYAEALEDVRERARAQAESVDSTIPLYITGHSLGGALATLYALWAASTPMIYKPGYTMGGHNMKGLVTFGAPKPATHSSYRALREKMIPIRRYVLKGDAATIWPPFMYSHPTEDSISLSPSSFFSRRHGISKYLVALENRL